jgi:hypothetical protein
LAPKNVNDVWQLLQSIGFEPYVVLGKDDFDEVVKHGGMLIKDGYVQFDPYALLQSSAVSDHVKVLLRELL